MKTIKYKDAIYIQSAHKKCPTGTHWNDAHNKCASVSEYPKKIKFSRQSLGDRGSYEAHAGHGVYSVHKKGAKSPLFYHSHTEEKGKKYNFLGEHPDNKKAMQAAKLHHIKTMQRLAKV